MPEYEAKRIANALAAPRFEVDGTPFHRAKNITKNNDGNDMWILSVTLERDLEELNYGCSL